MENKKFTVTFEIEFKEKTIEISSKDNFNITQEFLRKIGLQLTKEIIESLSEERKLKASFLKVREKEFDLEEHLFDKDSPSCKECENYITCLKKYKGAYHAI